MCLHSDTTLSDPVEMLLSIVAQLCQRVPGYKEHLLKLGAEALQALVQAEKDLVKLFDTLLKEALPERESSIAEASADSGTKSRDKARPSTQSPRSSTWQEPFANQLKAGEARHGWMSRPKHDFVTGPAEQELSQAWRDADSWATGTSRHGEQPTRQICARTRTFTQEPISSAARRERGRLERRRRPGRMASATNQ